MRFVWDEKKSRLNRAKHKVSFETAALVFDDSRAISRQGRFEGGEEVIRIISARKATPHERRMYEESL